VNFAGVMRTQLCAKITLAVERALEQRAHDGGLDKLPVRFRRVRQEADVVIRHFKHRYIFEQMSVEMANLSMSKHATLGHHPEKLLQRFIEFLFAFQTHLRDFREKILGQQAGIFREKTKHDAIEKTRDAQVLLLRHLQLTPGERVFEFDALPALK